MPFLAGCPSPPAATRATARAEQEDALGLIRDTVRKDHKVDTFKTAVAQLNSYLARPTESKPAATSDAERALFTKELGLSEEELKEVVRTDFSLLDAHYLDECFLLHDAIGGLKLDWSQKSDEAQLERARLGFAWAMRQVWLREKTGRQLRPSFVLRLGFGSAAERGNVALAVFRALGLDAGLIGSAREPSALRPWAVGVRVGDEVHLFDPRGGEPIVGVKGKGIATLRQLRGRADSVQSLPTGNADAKAGESRVWLSPALSSLSPRMRWLQSELTLIPPLILGVDVAAQAQRFAKAGETAAWWNPEGNDPSPTRLLAQFLPATE